MNAIRITGSVGALCLGLALDGCATPDVRHDGPNLGSTLARDCAGPSIAALRAGFFGPPFSFEISGVCLPIRAGTGGMHDIAPGIAAGASPVNPVADVGPVELRKLSSAERSVFPKPFEAGCTLYGYGC